MLHQLHDKQFNLLSKVSILCVSIKLAVCVSRNSLLSVVRCL